MIKSEVKRSLEKLTWIDYPLEKITEETLLKEDLNFDSLDKIEFLWEIEGSLGITFPDNEYNNIYTVGDVVRSAERLWNRKS